MSSLKSVLLFLTNQAAQFISCGIGCSNFSGNFLLSFLLWYDFKILAKWRGGGTFYVWKFWIWFNRILIKNVKIFMVFKVFFILPPVWLLNLGLDLWIDNMFPLDVADTKIGSQDAVQTVLELTKKWKYPKFRGKFQVFFQKSVGNL